MTKTKNYKKTIQNKIFILTINTNTNDVDRKNKNNFYISQFYARSNFLKATNTTIISPR